MPHVAHAAWQVKCEEGTRSVLSKDLEWAPTSAAQREKFGDAPPRLVHDDVPACWALIIRNHSRARSERK